MCGYVMQITDCTKVKYVDGRKKSQGTKLSKIVQENDAIAGINAGGFADPDGNGAGNILNAPVIMNQKLLYGNKKYSNESNWIKQKRRIDSWKIYI